MTRWIGRYEEGYISTTSEVVSVSSHTVVEHGWLSPEQAVEVWRRRRDLAGAAVEPYLNGLQHFDDVRERPEFAQLGVAQIWRRISFEPSGEAD